MSKLLRFKDSVMIEPSITEATKTDAGEMLRRDRATRLEIDIDATHSGVITNLRTYPGIYVSKGYKSFISKERGGTADYDKPILMHHNVEEDPIGRVVDAKYTPFKMGDQFEYDYLSPEEVGGKGSGVVTIKALITDSEAIQKIIDGRYLSVSAGHTSPRMLCSICGDSIRDCSHLPGEFYDEEGTDKATTETGRLCYGITGPMTYHECSIVNLPAQPPAKILNYNWKDSDSNECLTSFVKGKKELVRNFTLFDEDGELSLLNGKRKTAKQKTVIAVSPAIADKLKHVMSSDDPRVPDEASNVRQPETGSDSGAPSVEQNLDKAKNLDDESKKDSKMDNTKQLETLQAEYQGLKDKLATAEAKLIETQKQIEAKDSQIQRLTTDATELQTKVSKSLAVSLASIRVRLKKPGTEGIDTKEKLEAYVAKFATRTPDSLQDSLEDLLFESIEKEAPKQEAPVAPVKETIGQDKVTSPVLSKGAKPAPTTTKSTPKTAVDALSESFGLK